MVVSYGNRQRIFDKGDDGDRLLGVLAGQVRIYVISSEGRELIMNVIMPGELFGEISLIDGKPRSASAVAIGAPGPAGPGRAGLPTRRPGTPCCG